jgi:acetylornithine deacetylase/succinyl-diaminopimelate desuccinylase-like protein
MRFAVFLLACAASTAWAQSANPQQQRAFEIYRELVEINTVTATGDTGKAADAMAARLLAAGFPASDVQVFKPAPRKGNLVARLRGSGVRKPIILMAHIDVVEARPEDWSTDPFKLVEKDGYYYARGSSDDKSMAATWVANLIRYREEGFVPDRDLLVVLETDEEILDGNGVGIRWLMENRPELRDAAFALNEGASVSTLRGKPITIGVQTSEKVVMNYRLEVTNAGGHSAQPRPDNAIYRLAGALSRLARFEFPLQLNETTRAWLQRSAAFQEPAIRDDMLAVARSGDAEAAARLSKRPQFNATLRTTCVATLLEGGHAMNALPQLARATVNCRVMPGEPMDNVRSALVAAISDDEVKVVPAWDSVPSPPSPLEPSLMETIGRVSHEFWPGAVVLPIMSAGGTDGTHTRNAGIPTYGHSGYASPQEEPGRAHGRDERVSVKSFYEGQEYLYRLVKALSSPS